MARTTRKRKRRSPPRKKPPVELAPDAPPAIEALRVVEHLAPAAAMNLVLGAYGQDEAVRLAKISVLGVYRFPADEFPGLEWPALVVRADRVVGTRVVTRLHFAVFADVDGDLSVTPIVKMPADTQRCSVA